MAGRIRLLLIWFFIAGVQAQAQYADSVFPKPDSGYGADGPYLVDRIGMVDPYFPGEEIEVFYPNGVSTPVPTIFFCHGFGGTFSYYVYGLWQFLASKGYAFVFAPYPTTGVSIQERYDILLASFRLAARSHPEIIDTTQVGFIGHSFGGGAMFGVSKHCFTENQWGEDGRFLFSLAPWYAYDLSPEALTGFPTDVKLIMQVYDQDVLNDHRIAIDLFNHIGIPEAEKDYIMVRSDTIGSVPYLAEHGLPGTYQDFNALDYYALYRLVDALADYTFNGSEEGRVVALGHGDPAQVSMPPGLPSLVESTDPQPIYGEEHYEFPCSALLNPRRNFCGSTTAIDQIVPRTFRLKITPNPAREEVQINLPAGDRDRWLAIYDLHGLLVLRRKVNSGWEMVTIDVSDWPEQTYLIRIGSAFGKMTVLRP